ncbi:MAG: DUF4159 domain-containing protein [Pseudomonadota bacterium]
MFGISALSFSTPLLLSALAVLPAVYFLLRITPPSPERKPFPAFNLLRALDNNVTTAKRTPPWLLLLRLLVLALVIGGLAGPILNAPPDGASNRPLLIIVDNTWAAAADWRARQNAFDAIVEEARSNGRSIRIIPTAPVPGAPTTIDQSGDSDKPIALLSFSTDPYSATAAASVFDAIRPSTLLPDYTAATQRLEEISKTERPFDVRWLSDGLDHKNAEGFSETLKTFGPLSVFVDESTPIIFLPRPADRERYTVARLRGDDAMAATLIAEARDGRTAARVPINFDVGETRTEISLNLPIALRNEIARLSIEGTRTAGAVRLIDGREKRALVGVADSLSAVSGEADNALLSGAFFVRKALEPSADFVSGDVRTLARSDAGVIILDDVGRLRADDEAALSDWMENGGVLIRFAGDLLAEAVIDAPLQLSPTLLRGGGRAFGGALSWETPQPLGAFSETGPFADLIPPNDVFVKRQVLARPGGETSAKTWASLADGTPLVTGERRGAGALVLFHTTATPEWSDLPLAQIFVDMLERLAALSAITPDANMAEEDIFDERARDRGARNKDARNSTKSTSAENNVTGKSAPVFPAIRLLDGFGDFIDPPATFRGAALSDIDQGISLITPPGLYGAPSTPLAVNTINSTEDINPLSLTQVTRIPYTDKPPKRLSPYFFTIALFLFVIDSLLMIRTDPPHTATVKVTTNTKDHDKVGTRSRAASFVISLISTASLIAAFSPSPLAAAQPLDQTIAEKQFEAALQTRFAYVITGDAEVDRLAALGLEALSTELTRRTAVEPASPHGVHLETDDLTLYPMLYWPLTPATSRPSDEALGNLELFMRFGGLVIFDTRDDERAISGVDTPERRALKEILQNIDTPPLRPLPEDHVLKRSFYLLPDLPGRAPSGTIWVQSSGEANDAVTPLIVSGRDWAGAWARDDLGRYLKPIPRGGDRVREISYRAGINIAMVALTGNYKSDQVHTPVLLERLGK